MIRKYHIDDTDAVVSVWRAASEYAHPFLTKSFLDQEGENLRALYLPNAETWVTEEAGGVIGFIALAGDEIAGLFLDPAHHGRGYGRAMVDKAVAEKDALKVDVFRDNAIGRRFYAVYGFRFQEEYLHEPSGQQTLRLTFTPE